MAKIRLELVRVWHLMAGYFTHTVYKHHKGGRYRLLYIADECTNSRVGNRVVVYYSLSEGKTYTRDVKEWNERVLLSSGKHVDRFAKVY